QNQVNTLMGELAETLGRAIRDTDTLGFLEADRSPHFVIILPETDQQGATLAADKIRRAIASHDFSNSGGWQRITVSCGAATIGMIEQELEAGLMNRREYTGTLARAVETARIINKNLKEPAELEPDPALREAEFSRYLQGLPYWQIPLRRPLWFVHKARRGIVPGDESIEDLGRRVLEVARRMAREHPGETTALVSHADPIQAAWILLDGRAHSEREMYRKAVDKAGMLTVEHEGDNPVSW